MLAPALSPLFLALGDTQVSKGLTLIYINYLDMYLALDTALVSPGASTARIDRNFLFGNAQYPCSRLSSALSSSKLGDTQVSKGLALMYINHPDIYLGFDTAPVSPGASPGTLP